ncbi:hypothetical protein [Streptomyces ehimensis]|uniref:Alpha/beta hydrolase n=1 Tax=Streptomyces ehimensis TaxID=68195 RepID=A0ABV9BMQ8_9ACTN
MAEKPQYRVMVRRLARRHDARVTKGTDLRDAVILVHGTFAQDPDQEDEGSRWWQRNSQAWRSLEQALPGNASLSDGGPFHWSGKNSQLHRWAASTALLIQLLKLEQKGQKYHLVGHSHGGSVIWETLLTAHVIAHREKVPKVFYRRLRKPLGLGAKGADTPMLWHMLHLPGLQSWTTVGTPFLEFQMPNPPRAYGPRPSGTERIIKWLIILGLAVSDFMALKLGAPTTDDWWDAVGNSDTASYAWLEAFLITFSSVAMFPFTRMAYRRMLAYSLGVRADLSRQALVYYSGRWLGLWSDNDEAIAGLRMAATLGRNRKTNRLLGTPKKTQHIRRAKDTNLTFRASSIVPIVSLPLSIGRLVKPGIFLAFRMSARQVWARWLRRSLLRNAQGADLLSAELASVSRWPVSVKNEGPGLPSEIANRIEQLANERASKLVPALRRLIANVELGRSPDPELTGIHRSELGDAVNALIHTSYFDDPELLQLIGLHISRHSRPQRMAKTGDTIKTHRCRKWLSMKYAGVQHELRRGTLPTARTGKEESSSTGIVT